MNLQSKESKEFVIFLSIALLIILVFSFILFGATGIRVVLGIIFVSFPFYLILNNFQIEQSEKFVFAFLLGLTLFPSLVYILGLVISFRIAIIAIFIVLIILVFILRQYKSRLFK